VRRRCVAGILLPCRSLIPTNLRLELQMVDYSAQYRLGHKRCAGVVEVVDVLAPGSLTPGAFNVDHGRRYSVPPPGPDRGDVH
jgi:hypothetical protein